MAKPGETHGWEVVHGTRVGAYPNLLTRVHRLGNRRARCGMFGDAGVLGVLNMRVGNAPTDTHYNGTLTQNLHKTHGEHAPQTRTTCTGLPQTMRVNCMGSRPVGAVARTSRACWRHTSCTSCNSLVSSPAPGSAVLPAAPEGPERPQAGCKQPPRPSRNSPRAVVQTSSVRGRGGTAGSRWAMRRCCSRHQSGRNGSSIAATFDARPGPGHPPKTRTRLERVF